jgi:hypothetical protein
VKPSPAVSGTETEPVLLIFRTLPSRRQAHPTSRAAGHANSKIRSTCRAGAGWSRCRTPATTSPNFKKPSMPRHVAGCDASPDARRDAWRADDVGADRRHEGAAPQRRARVQPRSQKHALGQAEAEAGSVRSPSGGRFVWPAICRRARGRACVALQSTRWPLQ